MRIYALDPQRIDHGKAGQTTPRITVFVPYEKLEPGPIGKRIHVVDFDGVHRRYCQPVNLDHPDVLIRDGLPPSETDPRFHQQMVYAVVAGLWADFETALGRRVSLGSRPVLTIVPHAFYGENAYYDHDAGALLFGYFKASQTNPGDNLPGQMVFTCLSHDIIVHEATHALIDRLRPQFMLDTNPDVGAFHEGFSDLIAIFQHFKIPEVLHDALADSRGELLRSEHLLTLARQFGYSTGTGAALRTAVGSPSANLYQSSTEPHARGAVLVRAVFDAFLTLYNQRTLDLVRLASEGTGVLRKGALVPDLVHRLAKEAAALAQEVFVALIRAFDYLPPVDVTFEDFLRALVTVDLALSPSDDSVRVALIEGFRRHGIYPSSAGSLGDYAVAWTERSDLSGFPFDGRLLDDVIRDLNEVEPLGYAADPDQKRMKSERWSTWARELHQFAEDHREALEFAGDHPIQVASFHPTIRYRANGRPTYDIVVCFLQRRPDLSDQAGGVVPIAGTTVVASTDRLVRYAISKPIGTQSGANTDRLAALRDRVLDLHIADAGDAYRGGTQESRLRLRMTALHQTDIREGRT